MKTRTKTNATKLALFAGATALAALAPQAHAQSADSLIDKLVDKGVLTVDEARDLRNDADKDFKTAFQTKTGMPDWVTGYKISGDFRGRFDQISVCDAANTTDRDRFRYRLRVGLTVSMVGDLEAGLRLTSDEAAKGNNTGGDPISGNTTMTGNGSKKFIYVDQAYGKWSPLHEDGWEGSLTIGKMENPFSYSDIVFDSDYTPEGAGLQLGYAFTDQHTVRFSGGAFSLYEISDSNNDAYMMGGQIRLDSKWNAKWQTSLGLGYLTLINSDSLRTANVPDQNTGNWRYADGELMDEMNPWIVDASATYLLESFPLYTGAFPIKVGGDYMNNSGADDAESGWSAGVTFGKSGKKGLWETSYRYKYLEANAWYEELVDSDSGAYYGAAYHNSPTKAGYGSGTNIKGHVFKLAYSVTDALSLNGTYMLMTLVDKPSSNYDSATGRLQLDANLKF